jgi:plasmid maintenance system antidote protein VapI
MGLWCRLFKHTQMALRLSMAFGGSAESWLQQQVLYQLAQVRKKADSLNIQRLVAA